MTTQASTVPRTSLIPLYLHGSGLSWVGTHRWMTVPVDVCRAVQQYHAPLFSGQKKIDRPNHCISVQLEDSGLVLMCTSMCNVNRQTTSNAKNVEMMNQHGTNMATLVTIILSKKSRPMSTANVLRGASTNWCIALMGPSCFK